MRRWPVWLVLSVAMLVVVAQPAAAATAVASEHTTFGTGGGEPNPQTLTNMTVTGSGASASVETTETSATANTDVALGNDFSSSDDQGIVIKPTRHLERVSVTTENTGATRVLVKTTGGAVLGTGSISRRTGTVTGLNLQPGTEYRVVVDDQGDSFTYTSYNNDGNHKSSSLLEITACINSGGRFSDYVCEIESVTARAPDPGTYLSATHDASNVTEGYTDLATVAGGSVTVDWQYYDGNSWTTADSSTYTAAGNKTTSLSASADQWRVQISTSVTGADAETVLNSEGIIAQTAAPSLSNADPIGNTSSFDGSVSVNVSDADFATAQGDAVTVRASGGGTQIGSQTVSQNGSVSFQYQAVAGQQTVNWTATDSAGGSDTLTQQFTVNSDLIIRNETNTSQLVASPTVVEATFFGENRTVTKQDNDGTISFDGLPADQPFIVEVSADGYRGRTIYVPSLLQQQTVYLLPQNASSVQVRFRLEDASGTFSSQSVLYVEKPVNDSGNISYQVVVSDRFGTAGVTTFLEKNVRYDLRVVSERGDVAQIGSYGAAVNETVVLEPSVASIKDPDGADTIQYEAEYRNSTQEILIEYVDPNDATEQVTVQVVKSDGTIIKPNQTYYSSQTLSLAAPTNGELNQTAYVYLNGTRDNESFSVRAPVGPQQQDVVPDAADSVWVQIGAGAMVLLVGGVFSALNVAAGATITSLFAGVLWWLGIMSGLASGAAIALAIGLSTLNLVLNR